MNKPLRPAQIIFALGIAALSILSIVYSDYVEALEPVPSWFPLRIFWVYLTFVLLLCAAACIIAAFKDRGAAILLGIVLTLFVVILHMPKLLSNLHDGNEWTGAFETLALCGAAYVLAGNLDANKDRSISAGNVSHRMQILGRILFAFSLPVFGVLHFVYHDYVAFVQPSWIPWHQFWGYFVGIAFFCAALSILFNVKARLTSMLLGIMFGIWVVILHAPRVVASPHKRSEWNSMFIALAMCGASLIVWNSLEVWRSANTNEK